MADRIDSRLLDSQKAFFDKFYRKGKWELGIEPVLIEDCYYIDSDEWKNKTVLNKIDTGVTHELSHEQFYRDVDQLYDQFCNFFSDKYGDDMFDLMVDNTVLIAGESDAEYNTSSVNYAPRYSMTEDEEMKYGDAHTMFNALIEDGFKRLVPKGKEEEYRKRLEYEKYVIESTDNVDYYLITWDEINWARKNGIAVGVGRGSAGGCLLSFLLGITQIDPMPYNLLFERFLLPERGGLQPSDVTVIGNDIMKGDYVEIVFEGGKLVRFADDAEFKIRRGDEEIVVFARDLQPDDDVVFDRKDELFTMQEL
jgi:DNA polymerase-3 subunit alpha